MVVGGDIDDDLTLARALLSAALFAVGDSAPGVEWATTVLRTEIGVVIALTSTEGRGWLPPGLFLPTEVLIPWQWDSLLSTDDRQDMATLEGDADPARILAEFGRYVCRDLPGELSAVASSATVGDDVRAMLGDRVAVAERVAAEESSVDLSRPGAGLVDRLDMAGSPAAQQRAAEVLDSEIRAICLQLTQTGDDLVRKAVPGSDPEVLAQRARRHQAMEYLRNGGNGAIGVRSVLGKERHTSDAVGASVFAPVGAPPGTSIPERARDSVTLASSGAHIERARALERRADELVSLLTTGRADRQLLREILYTFDQVSEHPQLRAMTQALDMAAASKTAAGIRPAEYTSVPESPRLHSEQRSF
ncbi:hypothetical protein AB0L57_25590 [Nocardia sp. NPDC052254]|uniref:hypothetical protein n=1 Tax=Nocardia sp. NPDC052254 TaxID=3155681 RepID=UPI003446EC54